MEGNGVFVRNIPVGMKRRDLYFTFNTVPGTRLEVKYILFPVDGDSSTAYIHFKEFPEQLFRKQLCIGKQLLQIVPAPSEMFSVCTAVVDAVVVSCMPSSRVLGQKLAEEFGLQVTHPNDTGPFTICGSMLQLQAAQDWLRDEFSWQRKRQREEMMFTLSFPGGGMNAHAAPSNMAGFLELGDRNNANRHLSSARSPRHKTSHQEVPRNNRYVDVDSQLTARSDTESSRDVIRIDPQQHGPSTVADRVNVHPTAALLPNEPMSNVGFNQRGGKSMQEPGKNAGTGRHRTDGIDGHPKQQPNGKSGLKTIYGGLLNFTVVEGIEQMQSGGNKTPLRSDVEGPTMGVNGSKARDDYKSEKGHENDLSATATASNLTSEFVDSGCRTVAKHESMNSEEWDSKKGSDQAKDDESGLEHFDQTWDDSDDDVIEGTEAGTSVDLNYYVVEYLLRCQRSKVADVERQYGVKIGRGSRICDDIITVWFKQRGKQHDVADRDVKASEAFVSLVQSAYSYLIQKVINIPSTVSGADMRADIDSIHKTFRSIFIDMNEESGFVTLVGVFSDVTNIQNFIERVIESRKTRPSERNDEMFAPTNLRSLRYLFTAKNRQSLVSCQMLLTDITQFNVDVIVNATNRSLDNSSGVASVIERAGGGQLREDCRRIFDENGPLKLGEVVHTKACGALNCDYVIHTATPMWSQYTDKTFCSNLLQKIFENVMHYASRMLNAKTIAIPLIGTDSFGIPIEVCIRSFYCAVKEFTVRVSDLNLTNVYVICNNAATFDDANFIIRQIHNDMNSTPMEYFGSENQTCHNVASNERDNALNRHYREHYRGAFDDESALKNKIIQSVLQDKPLESESHNDNASNIGRAEIPNRVIPEGEKTVLQRSIHDVEDAEQRIVSYPSTEEPLAGIDTSDIVSYPSTEESLAGIDTSDIVDE